MAFGGMRNARIHPEYRDDLRGGLPHPLEDVDLTLPQLVVAAALHERSVQDHRLDADGAQQLDRRIEDDPVIRVAVVHVRELHLDVVVVDAARVVRVLGLVLDLDLRSEERRVGKECSWRGWAYL